MDIVRFTKIAAIISMFFWIVWCTFAPAPNSLGVTFGQQIIPPPMPRTLDFLGIIALEIIYLHLHKYGQSRPTPANNDPKLNYLFAGLATSATIVLFVVMIWRGDYSSETFCFRYVFLHLIANTIMIVMSHQAHNYCLGTSLAMGVVMGFIPVAVLLFLALLIAAIGKEMRQFIYMVWGLLKPERT